MSVSGKVTYVPRGNGNPPVQIHTGLIVSVARAVYYTSNSVCIYLNTVLCCNAFYVMTHINNLIYHPSKIHL